ncbi:MULTISPECIES: hypothetical protein [unclassified Streptomyces]|uniref:hypothetical protein n=1 Tax=unclassified Streptomyces TaxID=2593676 RepID=UPI00378C7723
MALEQGPADSPRAVHSNDDDYAAPSTRWVRVHPEFGIASGASTTATASHAA